MATSGVVWGLIPFLIRPSEPEWRAVVMLWLFGNQSVVTAVCSASRRVFQGATGSVTLVGALGSVLYGDSFGLILAGVLLFGGVYSVSLFGAMHQAVNSAIEARLEASSLAASLAQQQDKLESVNRSLAHLASRDELTDSLNRRSFVDLLVDERGRVTGDGWLVYLDLDLFKAVNDTFGHAAGDQVLQIAAERWRTVLPEGAVLARTGGDEFVSWLQASTPEQARSIAEDLRHCMSSPLAIPDGPQITLSCSIGVARASAGEPFVEAAARADRCLYTVKDQGRNRVALTTVDGQVPNPRDAGRFRGADRLGDGQNRPPPSVVPQSKLW